MSLAFSPLPSVDPPAPAPIASQGFSSALVRSLLTDVTPGVTITFLWEEPPPPPPGSLLGEGRSETVNVCLCHRVSSSVSRVPIVAQGVKEPVLFL